MMDKLREARARAEEAVSDHVITLYGHLIWLLCKKLKKLHRLRGTCYYNK